MGRLLGWHEGVLPVTEEMSRRLLRLPFFCEISSDDQDYVAQAMVAFFRESTKRSAVTQSLST